MISHTWFYLNVFLKYKKNTQAMEKIWKQRREREKKGKFPIITPPCPTRITTVNIFFLVSFRADILQSMVTLLKTW